jgi:hypothetical protein
MMKMSPKRTDSSQNKGGSRRHTWLFIDNR